MLRSSEAKILAGYIRAFIIANFGEEVFPNKSALYEYVQIIGNFDTYTIIANIQNPEHNRALSCKLREIGAFERDSNPDLSDGKAVFTIYKTDAHKRTGANAYRRKYTKEVNDAAKPEQETITLHLVQKKIAEFIKAKIIEDINLKLNQEKHEENPDSTLATEVLSIIEKASKEYSGDGLLPKNIYSYLTMEIRETLKAGGHHRIACDMRYAIPHR